MIPEVKHISPQLELYVYDLPILCPDTIGLIDENLVEICEGESATLLSEAKLTFLDFLSNKDDTTKIGAVAEFFIHLFLRELGYKQEFLFYNLEERSIKKGFDGYFSQGDTQFIVESKSGFESSKNISHKVKIKKAYNDIVSTIGGASKKSAKGQNNPWRNAYNHASHIDVGTKKSIRKNLKELSDLFDQGIYQNIENFNVIPCSTIFLDDEWSAHFSKSILAEEDAFFLALKAKTLKVVCITNKTISALIDYLEGRNE
ncbi:hypothetical protein [Rheinheimera sp. WS51]|uniref:hypothetical protein n=1 Tax=Rheinheimera sp. WS51 TaxID=3425886 RepID=UPI003D8B07F2